MDELNPLTWEERARIESGKPLCSADTFIENGDRLCTQDTCQKHGCSTKVCNC